MFAGMKKPLGTIYPVPRGLRRRFYRMFNLGQIHHSKYSGFDSMYRFNEANV